MVAVVSPEGKAGAGQPAGQAWYGVAVRSGAPVRPRGHAHGRPVPLPASTYRRRRAVAAGLAVVLVLALSAALGSLGGGPLPASERPAQARAASGALPPADGPVYVVRSGDSFWSIAHRLQPSGDPRPVVDRLVSAHGGSTLHVGERIPLPVR